MSRGVLTIQNDSSLPQEVRDVFERFITTEYTTVDGRQQPITWPVTPYYTEGAPTIDITTGIGYPKKARTPERTPTSRCSSPTRRAPGSRAASGCSSRGPPTSTTATSGPTASATCASRTRSCPRRRRCIRRSPCAACSTGTTRASTSGFAPRASSSGPTGTSGSRPRSSARTWRRCAPGHSEEPLGRTSPPRGRRDDGTRGSRSSGAATRPPCSRGSPPTASRSRRGCRSSLDPGAGRIASDAMPAGLPVIEGRACLTAHSHAPTSTGRRTSRSAATSYATDDGWALVPRKLIGGFELPAREPARGYPAQLREVAALLRTTRKRR